MAMSESHTPTCCICTRELEPNTPLAEITLFERGPRGGRHNVSVYAEVHEACLMVRLGGRSLLQTIRTVANMAKRKNRKRREAAASASPSAPPAPAPAPAPAVTPADLDLAVAV